jgi:hypothetical protein
MTLTATSASSRDSTDELHRRVVDLSNRPRASALQQSPRSSGNFSSNSTSSDSRAWPRRRARDLLRRLARISRPYWEGCAR